MALATATPMYRDLATGDKGDDVLALNNELARLGLPASAKSTTYTWNTSQGVKQLMSAAGNTSDGSLPLTDVLWIPAASVRVGEWAGHCRGDRGRGKRRWEGARQCHEILHPERAAVGTRPDGHPDRADRHAESRAPPKWMTPSSAPESPPHRNSSHSPATCSPQVWKPACSL